MTRRSCVLALAGLNFALLLTAFRCAEDRHPIKDATYVSPSGEERVSVQGTEIHFHIKIDDQDSGNTLDRSYNYTVLPDGRIQPHPMRSADAAFGVGKFDWYWDDPRILKKNPKTGETVPFVSR